MTIRSLERTALIASLALCSCGGKNGTNGTNGTNGSGGTNGVDGNNGKDGVEGMEGTAGSTGAPGMDGPRGPSGLEVFDIHADLPAELRVELVEIAIGPTSPRPVVTFQVTDGLGRGAVGLRSGSGGNLRFSIAKLTPAIAGEASFWTNYIKSNNRPTMERTGTLVDNEDGSYAYTFTATIAATNGFDPTLTHRLAIQLSGNISGETEQVPLGVAPPVNFTHDFVPSGAPVTVTREIVDVANCNQCHGRLTLHGARFETRYCVMCHNPELVDANGNSADMKVFIHKIHFSSNLPSVLAGRPYELAGEDYSETTLPLEVKHCRKCHNGELNAPNPTPQGNNWHTAPSREACGACHDNIDFTAPSGTPNGHPGGPQPTNANCAFCHATNGLAPIERAHETDNATPNNPDIPTGLSIYSYEIRSVTVDGTGHPIVAFRILRDTGSGAMSLDLTGTALPTTPVTTGGPAFILAYNSTDSGAEASIDYNQAGRTAAQPLSVSLASLRAGTAGTVTATTGGFYVATFTGSNAFPAGARLRAVGLQSYFSENLPNDTPDRGAIGRHTPSVIAPVAGDDVRRVVVDDAKCASCHEWLELHGGSRVFNTAVCVVCHNSNLTSSGRATDPVLLANQAANVDNPSAEAHEAAEFTIAAYGSDPLLFPEAPQNLKDLVHGIHSSRSRSATFEFVRDRGNSGAFSFDWSGVTYPNIDGDCSTCHLPGTYRVALPANTSPTTSRVTSGIAGEVRADIASARTNVPNDTDLVTSPQAGACVACHDSFLAAAHMEQNGGAVEWQRSAYSISTSVETCDLCHGPDRIADIEQVHPITF